MVDLTDKVVLVTGASSGIGAATAREFARKRARVTLFARREDRLEAVADEIRRGGGEAMVCVGDVTDPAAVRATLERMLGEWKRVDVLVNNAGRGIAAPFEAVTAQELRDLLEVNLVGVLTATQAVLPVMRRQRSGHIINVSSVAGRRATALSSAYNATKFALVGLSEALRQELRGTGIQVSIVYPIDTETEFHEVKLKKAEQPRYGPVQSAATVARAIVRCARRPRPEIYPYPPARLLAALAALSPRFVDWMMDRMLRR
ncbi:MAG TPA: SDR family NAD(P)-dependent oxidoreductase [Candidatus Methylomirabilis sp.]|nr:SDR family NAD(P)-dependent oxidoreductase [Candidatus Methylomirabilis sp.]